MMPQMKLILKFVDICLFKAGPEDIPANKQLLGWVLLAYFVVSVLINQIDMSFRVSLWSSASELLVLAVFLYLLLTINGYLLRYQQSLTALAATGGLLGLLALPLLSAFQQYSDQADSNNFLLLALILLMFWSLMVTAHIFRRALDTSAGKAVALTMFYVLVAIIINGLVRSGVA